MSIHTYLKNNQRVKVVCLIALPLFLYFSLAYYWSWRPRTIREAHSRFGLAAFSSNNRLVSGGDGQIKVWNVQTLELERVLPNTAGGIYALAVSPNGKVIAAAYFDR